MKRYYSGNPLMRTPWGPRLRVSGNRSVCISEVTGTFLVGVAMGTLTCIVSVHTNV